MRDGRKAQPKGIGQPEPPAYGAASVRNREHSERVSIVKCDFKFNPLAALAVPLLHIAQVNPLAAAMPRTTFRSVRGIRAS